MSRTVLFLCPHNAAKSLIAAALCKREASARGVDITADSAGTEPHAGPAPAVVARLAAEGIDVSGHRPRHVTPEDLSGPWRVVSLGCDAGALASAGVAVEHWDDIPMPSQDLDGAYESISERVTALIREAAARNPR